MPGLARERVMSTLTPEAATRVLRNGGAVRSPTTGHTWYLDAGKIASTSGLYIGSLPILLSEPYVHPDYPAHVFDRVYPCELTGHEAKALIMAAPYGMLEGQYSRGHESRSADWGYKCEDGIFYNGGWIWSETSTFTVRLRHGWLEKQRGMFAAMKGEEMKEETLTGSAALKAMEEGKVLESLTSQTVVRIEDGLLEEKTSVGWVRSNSTVHWLIGARFKIIPDAPTFIDVPLSCGLVARCEADCVKVDVPGCAVWEVSRERAEVAMKLAGSQHVIVKDFVHTSLNSWDAHVNGNAFAVYQKKVLFSELIACIDAMDRVKGGENG
jgi:hypothetical protein